MTDLTQGGNGNGGNGHGKAVLPSKQAIALDRLARRLHLTSMQRAFAHAYVTDPDRVGHKAAAVAGSLKPLVVAYRWLRMPKVKEYIIALENAALGMTIDPQGRDSAVVTATASAIEIDETIAEEREILQTATALMRARMGDFLSEDGDVQVDKVRQAGPGIVRDYEVVTTTYNRGESPVREVTTKLRLVDGLSAVALCGKFHGLDKRKVPKKQVNIQVNNYMTALAQMSEPALRELHTALKALPGGTE